MTPPHEVLGPPQLGDPDVHRNTAGDEDSLSSREESFAHASGVVIDIQDAPFRNGVGGEVPGLSLSASYSKWVSGDPDVYTHQSPPFVASSSWLEDFAPLTADEMRNLDAMLAAPPPTERLAFLQECRQGSERWERW